jgi:hypothetical protein
MQWRVYVSSTFEDLKVYRAKVNQALRPAGFQLVAMEEYPAFDQRPVVKCLADVKRSDCYVGILAHRYGYVPKENNPEGLSITEQEYRQAGEAEIPRLMFLLDPDREWQSKFFDRMTDHVQRGAQIERFCQVVRERHGAPFFREPDELATLVLAALSAKRVEQTTNDLASGTTGLDVSNRLIKSNPEIADAVSRSRQVLEDTHRQLDRLELFKSIHDAFHQIDQRCLALMQRGKSPGLFSVVKVIFGAQTLSVQRALQDPNVDPALREEIASGLQSVTDVLGTLDDVSWDTAFEQVIGELQHLVSTALARIGDRINVAARELKLDSLKILMAKVRDAMRSEVSEQDPRIGQLDRAIGAYERLDNELTQRVTEHSRLQGLDRELRPLVNSDTAPRSLASDWARIRRVSFALVAPFSPQLQVFIPVLEEMRDEIEKKLSKGDKQAFDLLKGYFEVVRTAFLDVDTGLKNFSGELGKWGRPLKDITDKLETC